MSDVGKKSAIPSFEAWAADQGYSLAKIETGFRKEQYASQKTRDALQAWNAALLALRQDSDTPAISEQCVSSSGPIGCYRVRCHLGKVCAAIAKGTEL